MRRFGIAAALLLFLAAKGQARAGVGEDLKALRNAYENYVKYQLTPSEDASKLPSPPPPWVANSSDADSCKAAWATVKKFLDAAEKAYTASTDWTLTAEASYSGDSAGDAERSKAAFAATFEAGKYPNQFRMKAGATLDFDNQRAEELSEDISEVVLQFDRYLRHDIEGFGFLERFSDTFMSIDQRYELGTGAKWEGNFHRPRPREGDKPEYVKLVELGKSLKSVADPKPPCLVDRKGDPIKVPEWVTKMEDENDLYDHLFRDAARVELGISLALLAEFEQADTLKFTTQIGTDPAVEQSFKPDGTQRYRLSIRPSLKWEITDGLEFRVHVYYKPALDKPRRVGGQRDYRIDGKAGFDWKLASLKPNSDKKVSLALEYDYRFDPLPPDASQFLATLGVPVDQITVTGRPAGRRVHSVTKFGIKVAF